MVLLPRPPGIDTSLAGDPTDTRVVLLAEVASTHTEITTMIARPTTNAVVRRGRAAEAETEDVSSSSTLLFHPSGSDARIDWNNNAR